MIIFNRILIYGALRHTSLQTSMRASFALGQVNGEMPRGASMDRAYATI
jgi:hypothetical protein